VINEILMCFTKFIVAFCLVFFLVTDTDNRITIMWGSCKKEVLILEMDCNHWQNL